MGQSYAEAFHKDLCRPFVFSLITWSSHLLECFDSSNSCDTVSYFSAIHQTAATFDFLRKLCVSPEIETSSSSQFSCPVTVSLLVYVITILHSNHPTPSHRTHWLSFNFYFLILVLYAEMFDSRKHRTFHIDRIIHSKRKKPVFSKEIERKKNENPNSICRAVYIWKHCQFEVLLLYIMLKLLSTSMCSLLSILLLTKDLNKTKRHDARKGE